MSRSGCYRRVFKKVNTVWGPVVFLERRLQGFHCQEPSFFPLTGASWDQQSPVGVSRRAVAGSNPSKCHSALHKPVSTCRWE